MSPGTERLAAVSVDLDEIPCYAAIFGLTPPARSAHAIYNHALDRLAGVFDDEGLRATFFAIGSDLSRPENAIALRALRNAGHEIASHSMSHLYDLVRRDAATIEREIGDAHDAIERAVGKAPVGFRAPGYTISDAVFDVLEARGYEYDSSVFPCPSYFAAKATAIAAIAARGRTSRSIVDDPRVLAAPTDPYRVGRPYWQRGRGLLERPLVARALHRLAADDQIDRAALEDRHRAPVEVDVAQIDLVAEDVLAARLFDAAPERAPVVRLPERERAHLRKAGRHLVRDLDRPITRPVLGEDDLVREARVAQAIDEVHDRRLEDRLLVVDRDDDRDLRRGAGGRRRSGAHGGARLVPPPRSVERDGADGKATGPTDRSAGPSSRQVRGIRCRDRRCRRRPRPRARSGSPEARPPP